MNAGNRDRSLGRDKIVRYCLERGAELRVWEMDLFAERVVTKTQGEFLVAERMARRRRGNGRGGCQEPSDKIFVCYFIRGL